MVCNVASARPRLLPLLLGVAAAAAALSLLLPAAAPDVVHAQSMLPPDAGNYTAGSDHGEFRAPEGVALFNNGTLVVADTGNHRIQVFGPNGTFLFEFGSEGNGTGEFRAPAAVSIDEPYDRLVVADTGNHRIQVFDFSGTHVLTFGSEGNGTGELRFPASATASINFYDDFLVADTGNHRIQTFYANGTHARTLGSQPDRSVDPNTWEFESPMAVFSQLGDSLFAVADTGNDHIKIFHYSGYERLFTFYRFHSLGSHGDGPREFDGPRSLDWARTGYIVADTGNDRVQYFEISNTVFDFTLGSRGSGPGEFMAPEGASMNVHEKIAVADTGNHRVQVFYPNRTLHFILGLQGNGTDPVPPPGPVEPDGNGTAPPTDGNGMAPPTDGNGMAPPTDGNGMAPPPDGNGTDPVPPPPPDGNGTDPVPPTPVPPADLFHIAPDQNGMLPLNQTGISREAATVEFALRTNFTRSGTGEPYTGQINVTVASDERRAAALAALAGLGNAGAAGRIGTVVEIGSPDEDIALDGIAIILLRDQLPHAKLYHMDSAGRITEVPGCGSAADPTGWLGGATAPAPFCHVASRGSAAMWNYTIYTYRLSAFFAVGAPLLPPPIDGADSCSIGLADASLAVSAVPGKTSQPVKQTINNTGSLVVKSVEINATRWFLDPVGDPPHAADAASLPSTLTEISTADDPAHGAFGALPADGMASLPLDAGLPPDGERSLWFRINLDGAPAPPPPPDGGLLVQRVEYVAECAAPPPPP